MDRNKSLFHPIDIDKSLYIYPSDIVIVTLCVCVCVCVHVTFILHCFASAQKREKVLLTKWLK